MKLVTIKPRPDLHVFLDFKHRLDFTILSFKVIE